MEAYRRAKEFEEKQQYDDALESLLASLQEPRKNNPKRESAIKDVAAILHKLGNTQRAIEFLFQHRFEMANVPQFLNFTSNLMFQFEPRPDEAYPRILLVTPPDEFARTMCREECEALVYEMFKQHRFKIERVKINEGKLDRTISVVFETHSSARKAAIYWSKLELDELVQLTWPDGAPIDLVDSKKDTKPRTTADTRVSPLGDEEESLFRTPERQQRVAPDRDSVTKTEQISQGIEQEKRCESAACDVETPVDDVEWDVQYIQSGHFEETPEKWNSTWEGDENWDDGMLHLPESVKLGYQGPHTDEKRGSVTSAPTPFPTKSHEPSDPGYLPHLTFDFARHPSLFECTSVPDALSTEQSSVEVGSSAVGSSVSYFPDASCDVEDRLAGSVWFRHTPTSQATTDGPACSSSVHFKLASTPHPNKDDADWNSSVRFKHVPTPYPSKNDVDWSSSVRFKHVPTPCPRKDDARWNTTVPVKLVPTPHPKKDEARWDSSLGDSSAMQTTESTDTEPATLDHADWNSGAHFDYNPTPHPKKATHYNLEHAPTPHPKKAENYSLKTAFSDKARADSKTAGYDAYKSCDTTYWGAYDAWKPTSAWHTDWDGNSDYKAWNRGTNPYHAWSQGGVNDKNAQGHAYHEKTLWHSTEAWE